MVRTPEGQADFELLCDLEARVRVRLAQVGYVALSEAERTLLLVWDLEAEVNNGGFHQYFFNSAGDYALDTPEALMGIGAKQCAGIVTRAIGVFPSPGPAKDRDERQGQLLSFDEAQESVLNAFTDEFYKYPEPLETLLAQFAQQRISDFARVVASATPHLPAIAIGRGDSFLVVDDLQPLTKATAHALGRFYRDLYLFDSDGMLWPTGARPSASMGWLDRVLNRPVALELGFGEPVAGRLSEVAEWLCDLVDADPDDLYSQGVTAKELKRTLRSAETAKDLIERAKHLGATADGR